MLLMLIFLVHAHAKNDLLLYDHAVNSPTEWTKMQTNFILLSL